MKLERTLQKLKRCMLETFSADPFDAYKQLLNRQMRMDESVDVYLADVRRLAKIINPEISDQFISVAFVAGLSESVKK